MIFRRYSPKQDEKAVIRIWKECGWLEMRDVSKKVLNAFRDFLECSEAEVAVVNGEAECLVTAHSAKITMLEEDLPLQAITSVTTGRPARCLGIAGQLTARAVMRGAAAGDALSALGIFDQGFYNRLGFAGFPYAHEVSVDPLSLNVPRLSRPPVRLEAKDISRMTANHEARHRHHGLVRIVHDGFLSINLMVEAPDGFGLGFENESGRLTHHAWIKPEGRENGPYSVLWLIYEDFSGLIELLSMFKSFGDQINMISFREPWGTQIQDLISRPFRRQELTKGSKFKNDVTAAAYQQARILNMEKTLAPLKIPRGEILFNLELTDPIEAYLLKDAAWRGLGGDWTIAMGEKGSRAERGTERGLPLMKASVNTFTRLVFGVSPASGLAGTGDLRAPAELLADLDRRLLLPIPDMEQDF